MTPLELGVYGILGLECIFYVLLAIPVILRLWVHFQVRSQVYHLGEAIPETEAVVVLGAGLWADGSPTPVLYDRVFTGVAIFKDGRARKILMSGDGRSSGYHEPEAMRKLALELGVGEDDLLLDAAGLRTFDSLSRTLSVYGFKRVTLVTQGFHMDRALYLANAIGLDAVGVLADRRRYRFLSLQRTRVREVIATSKAWLDILTSRPGV